VARRALRRVGLDRAASRLRITEGLRRANVTAVPSQIVAGILFWLLMLTFVLAATEVLGLRAVSTTIDRLVAYLPNVLAAALVVVLGFALGQMARRMVVSGAAIASLSQSERLGTVTNAIVLVMTAIVAVEQLGLKTDLLVIIVAVLVATFGITMGLAFALGARSLVTHILAGHYLRQSLTSGTTVEVGGRTGVVDEVGAVSTTFREGDRSWSVPNAALLEDVVVQ
jgi:hypothetical protein